MDGPLNQAKEVLGGYYLIEAEHREEALRSEEQFPAARTGCVEIGPVRHIETVRSRVMNSAAG